MARRTRGRINSNAGIGPGVHVHIFGASYDTTVALLGLHARSTFVAVLATAVARPCATEVAIVLARSPCVQAFNLVVRTQK